MKKSIILRVFAGLIIIVIILIIVTIFQYRSASMPSYQFLSGRGELIELHAYSDPLFRQIIYCCSFEADFNDICIQADKELSTLDYVQTTPAWRQTDSRLYQLNGQNSIDVVAVRILDKQKVEHVTSENFDSPNPDGYEYAYQEGWVSVEITQRRTQHWLVAKIWVLLKKSQ